jgi:branched-chain amino acid transport system ATP-binding protein
MANGASDILTVKHLQAGYGSKQVVFDADLHVKAGEIVGVIGHNGAGKSTTLHTIFGILPVRSGEITFDGSNATGRTCHRNVVAGMALARSERFVFAQLSVHENLMLGALWRNTADRQTDLERIYTLFPILKERTNQRAGQLSGGQQRMLSIGMAMMANPKLILLDEPSLGIAPSLTIRVFDTMRELVNEHGISVLIVEQNVPQLLRIIDRAYVMRSGRIVLEETVQQLRRREHYWDLF